MQNDVAIKIAEAMKSELTTDEKQKCYINILILYYFLRDFFFSTAVENVQPLLFYSSRRNWEERCRPRPLCCRLIPPATPLSCDRLGVGAIIVAKFYFTFFKLINLGYFN